MKNFGYKSNKSGFEIGTLFEYLDDFNLVYLLVHLYEKIETILLSVRQQKQEGSYFDNFIKINLIMIKEIKNLEQLMDIDHLQFRFTYNK